MAKKGRCYFGRHKWRKVPGDPIHSRCTVCRTYGVRVTVKPYRKLAMA